MDYKKLKQKIISEYSQIQIFFEKEEPDVELGEGGFYQAIRNDSLKVKTLENISKKLNIPMAYWWENEGKAEVSEPNINYKKENSMTIPELKALVDQLSDDKLRLKRENDEMRAKILRLQGKTKAAS